MLMKSASALLFLGLAAASAADVKIVEEIVAKVNNEIVTRGELLRSRRQAEAELRRQGATGTALDEAVKQAEKDALRERIDQLLLLQRGRDMTINVDTDVSKRLAQIQLENKITDPDKFQQFVREQTGMSFEDFKQQMKDQLITQRVVGSEVGSRITIPDAEVKKYYEEHKSEFVREEQVLLREIFLSTEGKDAAAVAAAEKKAKDLVARARKGEKFGEMARDNSDAATARNYGELPPYKRDELMKNIADLVFTQGKGYVTDPIRQPNGFLILRVEDVYKAGLQPLELVENEVKEKLYVPRMQPAVRVFLTKLRRDAFLEIREGWVDSGAAEGKDTRWKDPLQLKPATVTKEEVASRQRRRRLLWLLPIPGTKTTVKAKSR